MKLQKLWSGISSCCAVVPGLVCVLALPAHADCSLTNVSLKPLPEFGLETYKGFPGGLYPDGANGRPPAHLAAGLNAATNLIQPRDAAGNVNTNSGKIVLLSSGMSNTTQEWASKGSGNFRAVANADPAKNPRVVIADGAIGGRDAAQWTNLNSTNWQMVITQRLVQAGASTNQVQALWLKQAIAGESGALTNHARLLQSHLEAIVRNAKTLFPNLQVVYLSSRTRAYVFGSGLNPEPYAYETAFAVKWLIEKQIAGAPSLNADPAKGPVVAPHLSWGPYLWADGTNPRADGFTWLCSDVEADFTHPSAAGGVPKVANQLLAFFKTDPTAAPWFLKQTPPGTITCSASADVTNGPAPLRTSFSANAVSTAGAITQYVWTFDDGEFSYAQNPSRIFPTPGAYQARVTATDTAGNTATAAVTVTVNATFELWRAARFTPAELTNAAVSGPSANPDYDFYPNLLEYSLGLAPTTANPERYPAVVISNNAVSLSYPHFKFAADAGLVLESSVDLATWTNPVPTQLADHGPMETLGVTEPLPAATPRFFRLKAAPTP